MFWDRVVVDPLLQDWGSQSVPLTLIGKLEARAEWRGINWIISTYSYTELNS